MNIPPKYEDVVAQLAVALGREAALREDLASANSDKEAYEQNAIGLQYQNRKLREELQDRKRKHLHSCQIAIGKSQLAKGYYSKLMAVREELAIQIERANDFASKLTGAQQRLTVAEQRAVELEELLRECQPALDDAGYSTWQIDAALKPAEVNSVSCKFDWVKP